MERLQFKLHVHLCAIHCGTGADLLLLKTIVLSVTVQTNEYDIVPANEDDIGYSEESYQDR